MGVSGCGKSTVGQGLADALGLRFLEGDALHPPQNVERMAQGIALTDADRQGWLASIAQALSDSAQRDEGLVVACSALKRAYRDQLRAACTGLRFVFLHGDAAHLGARLAARRGHYMPASLLHSQLATLEPPAQDEHPVCLDIAHPPQVLVQAAAAALVAAQSPSSAAPQQARPTDA
jgi:gluconokinase